MQRPANTDQARKKVAENRNQLRNTNAELRTLLTQYRALTPEQKNGSQGAEMRRQIQNLRTSANQISRQNSTGTGTR